MEACNSLHYRILFALQARSRESLTVDDIRGACALGKSMDEVNSALHYLRKLGYVVLVQMGALSSWEISTEGHYALEAGDVTAETAKRIVSACHRAEPSPTAFLCFSEDELDDWWNGLDVEDKADAFAGFSLRAQGQSDSYIHIDDSRVRVLGAIGDNRAACGISQADGAGDQAVQS